VVVVDAVPEAAARAVTFNGLHSIALGSTAQVVSVSFRSERDARAFAEALNEQPLWVGRSRIACAD
jgi:hypothetical protein